MGAVPQRDADLLHLWTAYSRAGTPSEKAAALSALDAEVDKRDRVDSTIRSSVWALLQQPAVLAQLQVPALFTPHSPPSKVHGHMHTISPQCCPHNLLVGVASGRLGAAEAQGVLYLCRCAPSQPGYQIDIIRANAAQGFIDSGYPCAGQVRQHQPAAAL